MTVVLTFDMILDLKFLVTQQLPTSLKRAIGDRKNDIYASLTRAPGAQHRLVGSRTFDVDGATYLVFFVSDNRQPSSEHQPLRVTHIEKV